jgi:Ran GTPase-activating protein (RanGAP) involved in mRNA processing and transport
MAVTDDAKEVALGMVDVGTLAELKGVSQSWLALARRVLCSRLSRCEGQPEPTQMAEITDLNIKVLVDAGRPWEAAAAGRMLPSLARLRWEGFEVSVAAVRGVDLDERDEDEDEDEDERPFLGGHAVKTALLSCIEGEGEPPLELLLAAVACAGYGEIRGIPVQMMRDDSVSELDLQAIHIGVEGGMLLAYLVPAIGGLTALDLSFNDLKDEGVSAVCKAIQNNKETKLASLDFSYNFIGPVGANAVVAMVAVTGGLIKISLAKNMLGEEGTKAICEALEQNKTLKELDISGDIDGESNIGGTAGVKHVAKMLGVNGGLTSIDLSRNQLCGLDAYGQGTYTAEGIIVIADALRVNGALTSVDVGWNDITGNVAQELATVVLSKPTLEIFCNIPIKKLRADSLSELDLSGKGVGVTGALVLANLLPVTGALTTLDLSFNDLKYEGISAVCKAIKSNKETKLASLNVSGNFIGPVGANAVVAMVAVTGGLTSIDLSRNQLCGIWTDNKGDPHGTYTTEGITAIITAIDDALHVNGGLTSLNLSDNQLCGLDRYGLGTYTADGITAIADALRVNGGLTSINLSENQLCGIWNDWTPPLWTGQHGTYTAEGITAIADALRVNGGLTMTNLLRNQLDVESAKMLAEVAKQKGISLCGIQRDQTTAKFYFNVLQPPDAILLASDLSQAIVTGALTKIE